MTASHRLPSGGRIDRGTELRFTVDGTAYTGHPGDTVASALVANGVLAVAPSLYRGRPRGIVGAGRDEPNALLQVYGAGACAEPMLVASTVELYDGLAVDLLSGRGRLDESADTARHDRMNAHADVVVVGAGPAGIAAALAASVGGARVILVDDEPELGGSLLSSPGEQVDGRDALTWVAEAAATLAARPEVTVLTRSSVFGYYDHNYLLVVQRRTDHLGPDAREGAARQRLWHIRAGRVVLATGAHERLLVFANNDRPGIMLASAARTYVNRYAAQPGRDAVVVTTNDSAYDTAFDLVAAGARVLAVVDTRPEPPADLAAHAVALGIEVVPGSVVCGTDAGERRGSVRLAGVRVSGLDGEQGRPGGAALRGAVRTIDCDLLAVSGGWNPDVALFSQSRGTLRWDEGLVAFVPDVGAQAVHCVGAARGTFDLAGCLAEGAAAGDSRYPAVSTPAPPAATFRAQTPARPVWVVPGEDGEPRTWVDHFIDLQRDSTVADVWAAVGAGLRSVEHVKRYTTIGTGQDQGRTSGVTAVGVVAQALGAASPGDVGTTSDRAPSVPVSFALLAGRDRGALHDPVRTTPIHPWHVGAGAVFENVGQWKRPRYYPRPGEDMSSAVLRECRAARTGVAVMDASTLGKIEIAGADAGEFLNRLYTNAFKKLAVGSARYGVLCKADGMVFDDGVVLRLADDCFYATTTTGNAAAVLDWFEEWSQTEWPELDVRFTSVTEQWSTIAVVGPASRQVLARLAPDLDVTNDAFAFMTFRESVLSCGIPARIARISFSGELAYEMNVAGWYALAVWEQVLVAGADLGITVYGTETMHVLRAEKGYPIIGQDTDGTVTPQDLGMDWAVSKVKDFVGKRSFSRADTARAGRRQLVGLLPVVITQLLPEGAQLVEEGVPITPQLGPVPMVGHVTSSYRSAALGRTFALALVKDGRARIGQTLQVPLDDRCVAVTVTDPVLYDPEGTRRDG